MAASMKQSYGDEELLYSSSMSVTKMKYRLTKDHYPTALMPCLPPRCRTEGKSVAVTMLVISEREKEREREIKNLQNRQY